MISRIAGALLRAILVGLVIVTPALLLPAVSRDTVQIVALVSLFAAMFILFEYASVYPGLVEFRDAPPFNRIRFLALAGIIITQSLIILDRFEPSTLTQFVDVVSASLASKLDFPYSPVRILALMLPRGTDPAHVELLRTVGGISYLISITTLGLFILVMRLAGWPTARGGFNVWVNLPTFDPTVGGDVVEQLRRDSWANIALGFLLPFIIPAILKAISTTFEPITLETPQTMIWTVTAWSFLPTSLFMRGLAMGRIADMIEEKRRLAVGSGYLAA
ncbi:hypothetical protein OE699_09075 [Sedimentimonas flavescens]|uniref:Uncharacterized protein n=1 Tax=Sedimentimonas flavescens TaxID=2851012 RepID=A0ABT2ZZ37_9RHOB|nr:hypothetical protein [Sedimentimonas flavescens]MCV2879008.1 hypothetical protein [Sedimentimonas flavescens]WBL33133.1 hypothetical protein O5O51_00050 [Sinirhodobacter sp. HNIBRBA609]